MTSLSPDSAGRRLLCIYQHAPTPGAPGIYRHRTLLAELVRRGWHVDLISSPINYMSGEVPAAYRDRLPLSEVIDGIHHHWVPAVTDIHRSKIRRIRNYLSFGRNARRQAARLERPDVVWASSPPLTVAEAGVRIAHKHRAPWVYEVRDLWPESAVAVGWLKESSFIYRAIRRRAQRYAVDAAAVIVPTPALEPEVRTHGAAHVTVVTGVVSDAARPAAVRESLRAEWGCNDATRVYTYVGAHGAANGLDIVLEAAKLVADLPVQFVLAGDGGNRAVLQARVADEGISNVLMLGSQPKELVPDMLAASDVCLHVLRPDELFQAALPTKVLEYFGAHRSFITTVDGLPRKLAAESGGSFAPTAHELADTIRAQAGWSTAQLHERGEQSFDYGQREFGLQNSVDRLEQLLIGAINS